MTSHLIHHKSIIRIIGLLIIVVGASSIYACPPPPQCDPPDRYVMWAIKGSTIECKSEESTNLFLDYNSAPHTIKFAMVAQIYLNGQWSVWAEWADYSSMDSPGCGSCDSKQCTFPTPSGGTEVTRSYTTITVNYPKQPLAGYVRGTHNGWECFKDGWGYYVISGGSQITMNVYVVKVDIKRNGASIVGQNPTVSVGDKISLTGSIEPNDVSVFISSQDWTIEGNRIKNYIASVNEGRVENLSPSDLLNTSINYYWVGGGEDLEVKYFYNIASKAFGAFGYFDVKRPSAIITSVTNSISAGISDNKLCLQYGTFDEGGNGVILTRTNFNLNGAAGSTYWIQKMNNTIRKVKPVGGVLQEILNVSEPDKLDSGVPYPYTTNNGTIAYDSPKLIVTEALCAQIQIINEQFSTYLMFKPNTDNSIYVPLRKVDWYWSADLEKINNVWTWNGRANNVPVDSSCDDFPTWTGMVSSS